MKIQLGELLKLGNNRSLIPTFSNTKARAYLTHISCEMNALSHGANFFATCNAILLLGDFTFREVYSLLIYF